MIRLTAGRRLVILTAAAVLAVGACGGSSASKEPIKLGGLATLEGPFAVPGQDSFRGIEQALNDFAPKNAKGNWEIAGREITLFKEGSDATPAVALEKAKKLIEQDNVDILIGPLSGDEGLAVKDYAKTVPDKTFVNGSSAAQDTTFRDPAPNFYRFSTDGAQWMAGLGKYAFEQKGYKNVALVAEDYSFPYTQVGGFMYEFCAAGGHVVQKNWVPLGTKDYSSVVSNLPTSGIDAIYVALGGADAVNFFTQYTQAGGKAKLIGGSITVDQSVLATKGAFQDILAGTIAAGPTADTATEQPWLDYVKAYKATFPDGLPYPGLFALSYYNETKGVLQALKQVNGDLGNGEKAFMDALAKTSFDGPTGHISLDANRQAIGPNYVTEVQKGASGALENNVISKAENIDQTLGLGADSPYLAQPVSRDFPGLPVTVAMAPDASAPALRLQGVGRRFGALEALRDVTMEVAVGERRAILGPNGAGKTTLFNVVAGDYLPTSGSVELYGADVTRLPPHRRTRLGLARTYQSSLLFMGVTVAQSLFLAIRGVQRGRFDPRRPPANDPGRVRSEEIATLVHLDDVFRAPVGALSHGQQRQLELGMALAASPRLLMLDEPAAGLSRGERGLLTELLRGLPREITVVLVEHDMDVALAAADRVTVMYEGTIIVEGSPDAIQADPTVQDIYLGHQAGGGHAG